jgi:hypothetical protein
VITVRQGMQLSAIVDKLELTIPDPGASQEKLGADVFMQILSRAHRADEEIYAFIAEFKGCTPDEAQELPLSEVVRELMSDNGVLGFFSSAAKSQGQE